MSVKFKFRSSVNFETLDLEGRPSISVCELRFKVIRHKNLNLSHDFDLVFSDHITGREYNDENFQIPKNSSVIIKRVPAGSVRPALPIDSIKNMEKKNSTLVCKRRGERDDFGIDLCPGHEEIFPCSDLQPEKKNDSNNEANIAGSRVAGLNALSVENALPSELKCSICSTFFKNAVMIRCCQHSFCDKCIRGVLLEKAKCPRCSSDKVGVEDLLPNLSLRHAIEHFLESQIQLSASENALHKHAPDEESGIQAKEFSNAVSIAQKRPSYPISSSATEKGSNKNLVESFYGKSQHRKITSLDGSSVHINIQPPGKVLKAVRSPLYVKQTDDIRDGYAPHVGSRFGPANTGVSDFQGENDPQHLPQNLARAEGGSSFMATAKYKKAERTCYGCDAPDHFIRACPFAPIPHSMVQTVNVMHQRGMENCAPPYWNNNAFGPMRPFTNMYGYPAMMPFNASMVPVTPNGVSPYMSSMYGHLPSPSETKFVGPAPPVGNRTETPFAHTQYLELQNCESRGKLSNDYMLRRQPCGYEDDDFYKGSCCNVSDRSHECKSQIDRENSESYSGDDHFKRSQRKHHYRKHYPDVHSVHDRDGKFSHSSNSARDQRPYHTLRSNSGMEDVFDGSDRHDSERYNQHHETSRKHQETSAHSGSDSSFSRRQAQNEKYVKRRFESDGKSSNQKYASQLRCSVEPSSSGDQKKQHKERDYSQGSRHSRDGAKLFRSALGVDGQKRNLQDEDHKEDLHHPKRKRVV